MPERLVGTAGERRARGGAESKLAARLTIDGGLNSFMSLCGGNLGACSSSSLLTMLIVCKERWLVVVKAKERSDKRLPTGGW